MTTSMSSTSDGVNEASSSENRLPLINNQNATSSSHRSSYHDQIYSENDGHRTTSHIEGSGSHDQGPTDRRVSKSKGFLLDSGTKRQSLEKKADRYGSLKRSSVAATSGKGKTRANRRSLLGVDVMNIEDEKTSGQDNVSYGEASADKPLQTKHGIQEHTDQAQIVNLALNLSESRRRHFSSNRIPSMNEANIRSSPKMAVSPLLATPNSIASQPRPLQSPSARSSADINLSTPNSYSSQAISYSPGRRNFDSNYSPRTFGLLDLDAEAFSPSEATLLRVQKAKESLELLYEYRRLLQFLPRLPTASNNRSQPGSKGTAALGNAEPNLGREYNTLQYIRNRKIRRRENKPLNAIGQGWKHVNAVRQWVEDVSDEREKRVSSANDRYPLPHFPPNTSEADTSMQAADSTLNGSANLDTPSKETRPRVDWMIEPWNLLADAYWLEEGNNKQLIEDSKSRKVYPPILSAPIDLRKEAVRASARRSSSIPRSIRNSNSIPSLEPDKQDDIVIERGRQLHTRHDSIESGRGYSGSRDRKGAWRRFIGSQSASSTEESISGTPQLKMGKPSRMSMKERQQSLILERQIKELMAKQPRYEINGQEDDMKLSLDDPVMNGMSSRPSSPEDANMGSLERDLSLHLGLVDRTREMQPRRFSSNLSNVLGYTLESPSIAINISPPRSRSRGVRQSSNISTANATTSLFDSEDEAKLSPKSAHRLRRTSDAGSEFRSRKSKDFDSRLRGLLKGTKIMDKVSQPVVRVSDLLRKRDDHSQNRAHSPAASNHDGSDVEDVAAPGTMNGNDDSPPQISGQYRPAKLPSFSLMSRGRQNGRSADATTSNTTSDRSAAPTLNRSGRAASQFLKIETMPQSPVTQPIQSSEKSISTPEVTTANSIPRQRSTQRRHAITRLGGDITPANSALAPKQISWPDKDSLRWLNVTQRLLSPIHRKVNSKDIAVLQALTQCTLLTSNSTLHQKQDKSSSSKPNNAYSIHASVRRQISSSDSLLASIRDQNAAIKVNLSSISQTTIPEIHSSLIDIETYILDKLTPIVRTAGDSADKLSAELATTRTLEVKKLNDELDFISRRRRRKLRWLRRGLYWGLEWTLLGLMWWAWLVVVCLRLVRGVFRVTRALVVWLFWL